MSESPSKTPARPADSQIGELVCADCEYALTGLPTDRHCPECGLAIDESIRVAGGWTRERLRRAQFVIVLLSFAAGSWIACALLLLLDPTPPIRLVFVVSMLVHAAATIAAALLAVSAASRMRAAQRRTWITALSVAAALPLFVLVAAIARMPFARNESVIVPSLAMLLLVRAAMMGQIHAGIGALATTVLAPGSGRWPVLRWLTYALAPPWLFALWLIFRSVRGDLAGGVMLTAESLLMLVALGAAWPLWGRLRRRLAALGPHAGS